MSEQQGRPLPDSMCWPWLQRFGWPAVLGMAIFAAVGAVGGYVVVNLIWRLRVWFKRHIQRHGR